jgi:AcrR family transcriptional regulator
MTTTERRAREARHRRTDILDAARQVFWRRGYQSSTIPDIAAQAELAPGTLYLYFPGKDALYVELLVEGYQLLERRLVAAVHAYAAPSRQIPALIDAFFDFAREYPAYFDIVFFVLQKEREHWEGQFAREQIERLRAAEARCQQVVAELVERVSSLPARRREAVVSAAWSMLAGVVFYFRAEASFPSVAAEARRLLLAAVLREEG